MNRKTLGLRHVALFVKNLEACRDFYVERVGMTVEWQPDADNVYLTTGHDNLALHRAQDDHFMKPQRLDHIGFCIPTIHAVDDWFEDFVQHGVKILMKPKTHRDGARSFYCEDPAGAVVQMIYIPNVK